MKTTYAYNRLHLPSGSESVGSVECYNVHEFHKLLADWNRLGGSTWKYWAK